ncbi:MAG: type IV pilus assembly protein PilM [Planctomycetota bacterium]|jgi:type IV pilus assembly protein PilM
MAATAVWGLDIGQNALKAVKAVRSGPRIEIIAFDHIEYRTPASGGGDQNAAVREALQTFLSRNDVTNCQFAVAMAAGRSALIRFIKLPPVDRRKVPDIIRYEATQQIPFPLEDVIWDYQVVEREYAPGEELEAGIFAMRREAIFNFLSNLMVTGIEVEAIQLSAAAVYNCVRYDQMVEEGAIMAVDIGAESTNLIIVDGDSVWTRSLPIGGNDFTRAIATKYSLEFEQAETLKRSMDRSKKAQEIFEALRPSLRSLLDEIQRSAGYYRSLHKQAKFVKLIGFGNGFKMYGVKRFLETGLAYPVEVFGRTNNIGVASALNLKFFKKGAPAFGAALGLAVQALGLGGIDTNLMPPQILKERMLKSKRPMIVASAAMLAGACFLYAAVAFLQDTAYPVEKDPRYKEVKDVQANLAEFNKLTDAEKVKREIESIIDVKGVRTEPIQALNALMASIPVDEEYPIYIQSIAMESGNQNYINNRLRSPFEETKEGGGTGLVGGSVKPRSFITQTAGPTAVSRSRKTERTEQSREEAVMDRMVQEDARFERRLAKMLAGEAVGREMKDAEKRTARAEKGVKLTTGFGYVAQLYIETAHPEKTVRIRAICDEMKKNSGVRYCNFWFAQPFDMWEHKDTHAREMTERLDASAKDFDKIEYTVAIVQWVYEPVVQEIAAQPTAEAAQPESAEAPTAVPVVSPAM